MTQVMRNLNIAKLNPLLTLLIGVFSYFTATGQMHDPVTWKFDSKPIGNGEFELYFKAEIEAGWHLYGTDIPEDGPIPTSFMFEKSGDYELIGEIQSPEGTTKDDPVFMMTLTYFDLEAVFVQKVRVLTKNTNIKGELEFMTCDDEKCLPPELVEFDFPLQKEQSPAQSSSRSESQDGSLKKNETGDQKPEKSNKVDEDEESGILKPVTWSFEHKRIGEREFEIIAHAKTEGKWHIYSAYLPADDGPIATEFNLLKEEGVKEVSDIIEVGDVVTEFDENFQLDLSYFKKNGTVIRRVKIDRDQLTLPAEVYFMTCDDKRCLTPEGIEHEFELSTDEPIVEATQIETLSGAENEKTDGLQKDASHKEDREGQRSLWVIFLLSFGGGFAALLTPCVFPMIPMTVSFFTKQSKTRAKGISNAIIYGVSIIALYTLLGFAITYFFGADALNAMSTNEWFNFAFFVLLMVFAISFLGAFEITLPSSWVNKADRASDRGGLIGIFFMAVTLSLVSFSCTGPIIGTLLVDAAVHGGIMGPLIGMFGFSLALALPFGLFAAFPGWLNAMPKSGGWLNTVKVVLGFLEMALAFKFLSNADLVLQLGIITREVFLAIWIGIMIMLAIYLLGLIRMPHDSPLEKLSVGRSLFATLTIIFIIYMIPGMWGAPLKVISGFPPPMHYSESPQGVGFAGGGTTVSASDIPEGADPDKCPHNLNCFKDYEVGMEYAKTVNKPVLLDFTGHACVNCRKMEEQVWSDARVLELLRDEVVLISLYVDERKKLPEDERFVSEVTGKKVKTVGNKWSAFQAERFGTNSQPYYQFVNLKGDPLGESAAYDPNINKYINWLETGIELFEGQK